MATSQSAGRSVPKKGYIGPVSTKTHSGDSHGTGGFGGFLGSGRFLALKFGFYKKFHRQNWLETKESLNPEWLTPEWVLVLGLVVLVVLLVVLAVVS